MLDKSLILSFLSNSKEVTLSKLLNGIGYQPNNKGAWAELFRLLDILNEDNLISIKRNKINRIESISYSNSNDNNKEEIDEVISQQKIEKCWICKKDIIEKDLVEYKGKSHFNCMLDFVDNPKKNKKKRK